MLRIFSRHSFGKCFNFHNFHKIITQKSKLQHFNKEGRTEEENNSYVDFNQLGKLVVVRGEGVNPPAPSPSYSMLQDRFKDDVTGYSPFRLIPLRRRLTLTAKAMRMLETTMETMKIKSR